MTGTGGTDSAVVVLDDEHPYSDRFGLFLKKIGEAPEQEETPYMVRGKMMEPIIAEVYHQKTGRAVSKHTGMLRHPDFPFIIAHPDYDIIDEQRGNGCLEIKCFGLKNFSKAKREGAPLYTQIQEQHYLGFPNFTWGSIAIFNAERWELLWYDIEPDCDLIGDIYAEDQIFWDHVVNRIPPQVGGRRKIELPATPGQIVKMTSEDWRCAVHALRNTDVAIKALEAEKETTTELIKAMMEEVNAEIAEGAGAKIHWKNQQGRESFDKERFAAEHPEIDLKSYYKRGNPFPVFRPYFGKEVA